jgi:hypothetical protein
MKASTQAETLSAQEVIRQAAVTQAPSGVCYATLGEPGVRAGELERMLGAVPAPIAAALARKAYYFVPLVVSEGEETLIADRYDLALSDRAVCHRNVSAGDSQCVFISTRLVEDAFSLGFEFYINVAHAFVEVAGVSHEFSDLVWKQAESKVRGETSMDAHELRKLATARSPRYEQARGDYFSATFADAIAVYLLSLFVDVDYEDLRERDYPLLASAALAERLRKINELFPPPAGFTFAIYTRRRA